MTDDQLLSEWRMGDRKAGQQLFQRHAESVRRFVSNKVDNGGQEAEELIQRVFLACIEGRDRFEGRSSFRTYLLGIAHNLVRQHWQARRVQGKSLDIDDLPLADLCSSPSSVRARSERERCLLEGLRRVSLGDQTVLELYYWERLNAREISEVLNIPTETAQSKLRRARERLRKQVSRLEQVVGVPQTTDDDLDKWAGRVRDRLVAKPSR